VEHPQERTKPNVLLILTDQHRWDCLGAAGNPDLRTPHLDALAADGVRFANAFCPLPVCTPSRYSILSGLYVHQHGGWTNRCTLNPALPSFPRQLQRAGYHTHAVGKMHFTPTYLDAGFDALELAEQDGDGRLDDDYHRALRDNGLADAVDVIDQRREYRERAPRAYWETFGALRSDLPEEWHSTTWIGDRAVAAIETWAGAARPNLLVASFIKPHHPFDPPAPWDSMYDPDALTLLPGWTETLSERDRGFNRGYFPNDELTEPVLRRAMAYYYATISQVDHQVGRMVAALKRQGIYEDTLVIFTADHGEYLGFHHMLLKSGHMYDPLMRVPLLVKQPSGITEGAEAGLRAGPTHSRVSDALVGHVDLAPTILRAAGLEPPPAMPGADLADANGPAAQRDFIFAESRQGAHYMARSRTHKLLLGRDPRHSLFFDLRSDPHEQTDLLHDPAAADLVRAHRDALVDWLLFQTPTPVYVDSRAPLVDQPNARPTDAAHRRAMLEWYDAAVERYLARQ
jgi:arylsulfatase A-like enzyme